MKRVLFSLCVLLSNLLLIAQEPVVSADSITPNVPKVSVDTLLMDISYNVEGIVDQLGYMDKLRGRYKIYKTENLYNLLKLDTATGRIEQVQWSLNDDKEFTITLNSQRLSYSGKIGTFELFPTNNMYQFILLDTTDGRVWHVQWGTESKKRWIRRIY